MNEISQNQSADHPKEPWQIILEEAEPEFGYRELSWDPQVLQAMFDSLDRNPMVDEQIDEIPYGEQRQKVELIRRLARTKLKGVQQQAILIMLSNGAGPKRIALMLQVSEDTVRRAITKAVERIRECLKSDKTGDFPVRRGKRPVVRAAIFPLDVHDERERFQNFINEHTVMQVSYRGDEYFREALVLYLTHKKNRITRQNPTVVAS